jgi:hypothetical protein
MDKKELLKQLDQYNNFQILLAIKKIGEEVLVGFSGLKISEVPEVLETLEAWELLDILNFIK